MVFAYHENMLFVLEEIKLINKVEFHESQMTYFFEFHESHMICFKC